MLKSPCLACEMVGQDKNKCLQNCDKLKEYQENRGSTPRYRFTVATEEKKAASESPFFVGSQQPFSSTLEVADPTVHQIRNHQSPLLQRSNSLALPNKTP